jgi:hypothetical protein
MGLSNVYKFLEELTVFLRNQDIFSISLRGVTTASDLFSGTGSVLTFTLTRKNVKNVRFVKVNSVTLRNGIDYLINYKDDDPSAYPTVTFTIAPPAGSNNVEVNYDYGNSDRIYPDMPRVELTLENYPRIGFDIVSAPTSPLGIGGTSWVSDYMIACYVWYPERGAGEGTQGVNTTLTAIRQKIQQNAKNFYNFKFISPTTLSPIIVTGDREGRLVQRSIDLQIMRKVDFL